MQDIAGKTAIITGASSGFGRASAYALAREGVNLVLTARSADKLAAICAECEELGVTAISVPGDCRDEQNAIDVVRAAMVAFGRIDILLANAGICISGPFLESTMDEYDEQMDTNMRSMYAICLHALPQRRQHHVRYRSCPHGGEEQPEPDTASRGHRRGRRLRVQTVGAHEPRDGDEPRQHGGKLTDRQGNG